MKARSLLIFVPAVLGLLVTLAHFAGVLPSGLRIVWAETWFVALAIGLLTSADAQAQRMGRLVGDLRKLADLEQQQLALADVNMADLLNEAVTLAKDHPRCEQRSLLRCEL